jgi:hypothetical protein
VWIWYAAGCVGAHYRHDCWFQKCWRSTISAEQSALCSTALPIGAELGAVSSGLLRYTHCPVAIIHDEDPLMSQPSQAPVLVGKCGLVGSHAWNDPDVSKRPGIDWPATESMTQGVLAERLAGWREQYPDVQVDRTVVCDQPARQLVQWSEAAQPVVVGSRGRGGFAGMLVGSVGETVTEMARVPVVRVPVILARESVA